MYTGILNISFSLRRQFLPQIYGVLLLDIFDDWVPAALYQSYSDHIDREVTYQPLLLTRSP